MGIGVAVFEGDSLIKSSKFTTDFNGSSIMAEYYAIIAAIKIVNGLYQTPVWVKLFNDNKTVVNQVSGNWQVHSEDLIDLYECIKRMREDSIHKFMIMWIPRETEGQRVADALSKKANPYYKTKKIKT